MPKGLKRYYGCGDLRFLTFSCFRRLPLLGTAHARNPFVSALEIMRERYQFRLVGNVVMPEHVHLLISEPAGVTLSAMPKVLKRRVSRDLRRESPRAPFGRLTSSPLKDAEALPQFWQPRFYDFNVYSAKKGCEKLEYRHANPVERGLMGDPSAWIWSSFSYYAKGEAGLLPIDPVN